MRSVQAPILFPVVSILALESDPIVSENCHQGHQEIYLEWIHLPSLYHSLNEKN